MSAHKGNPAPNVGGTAKDGGLSTGATVADGGPNDSAADPSYAGDDGKAADPKNAGPGNAAPGVGGTAKDGGLSTAATVADGGPDDPKADPTYKP